MSTKPENEEAFVDAEFMGEPLRWFRIDRTNAANGILTDCIWHIDYL